MAYTKDHGITAVISIPFADAAGRAISLRRATGQPRAGEPRSADDPTCHTRPPPDRSCKLARARMFRRDLRRPAKQPAAPRSRAR